MRGLSPFSPAPRWLGDKVATGMQLLGRAAGSGWAISFASFVMTAAIIRLDVLSAL